MLLCSHKSAVSLAFSISYDSTALNKVPKIKEPRCNKQDLYFKKVCLCEVKIQDCVCVCVFRATCHHLPRTTDESEMGGLEGYWLNTHTPISLLTATVNPLKMGSNVIERHSGSTHPHTVSRATSSPALIWSTCYSCNPLNSWETRFHTEFSHVCMSVCLSHIFSTSHHECLL